MECNTKNTIKIIPIFLKLNFFLSGIFLNPTIIKNIIRKKNIYTQILQFLIASNKYGAPSEVDSNKLKLKKLDVIE